MLKKSYFTRSISRTPANNKEKAICDNSLQLKAVHYSIVTRSSILNISSGCFWLQLYFVKFLDNLKIFQWKVQKLGQPSNQNHSQPRKAMFLPRRILKFQSKSFKCYIQFNTILHIFCMPFLCHLYIFVCHSYVIRLSLVCTRMSSICHSYVLAWDP